MPNVTQELASQAAQALASGDMEGIRRYWAEGIRWLVPGHSTFAGWYSGRDAFIAFLENTEKLSDGSFRMQIEAVLTSDDYATFVTHAVASHRDNAGQSPYQKLDITTVLVTRWQNGQIVEGKGAVVGDGSTQFDQFWSLLHERNRVEIPI